MQTTTPHQRATPDLGPWPACGPTRETARLAYSVRPEAEAAYAAHSAGAVGVPPTDHHTWRAHGGRATGGGSSSKMLLGRWHEHVWRMANLPDNGRMMETRRGRLPTVRGWRRWRLRRIGQACYARLWLQLAERTNGTVE
jgi:hypothetical protein